MAETICPLHQAINQKFATFRPLLKAPGELGFFNSGNFPYYGTLSVVVGVTVKLALFMKKVVSNNVI